MIRPLYKYLIITKIGVLIQKIKKVVKWDQKTDWKREKLLDNWLF